MHSFFICLFLPSLPSSCLTRLCTIHIIPIPVPCRGELQGARFESLDNSPMYDNPGGAYQLWNSTTLRMQLYVCANSLTSTCVFVNSRTLLGGLLHCRYADVRCIIDDVITYLQIRHRTDGCHCCGMRIACRDCRHSWVQARCCAIATTSSLPRCIDDKQDVERSLQNLCKRK